MFASLEQFPSKTSSIASIPWEETSCGSISGASVRIINRVKVIISGNRREGNIDGYQLFAGFLQLKVGCSRREFIDQLVNRVAEAAAYGSYRPRVVIGLLLFLFCHRFADGCIVISVKILSPMRDNILGGGRERGFLSDLRTADRRIATVFCVRVFRVVGETNWSRWRAWSGLVYVCHVHQIILEGVVVVVL